MAVALAGAIAVGLAWLCVRDPKITFLPGDGRAEWIVFPSAPDAMSHPVADLDVVFRREFTLAGPSRVARLSVRAAKHVQLNINGQPVDTGPGRNWKDLSSASVSAFLHAGTNVIEATVFNDNAPPALWLVLVTDRLTLRSDRTWETSFAGSAWRRAARATAPRIPGRGNLMAEEEGTFAALAAVWPVWMVFGGFSIAIWSAGRWWFNRIRTPGGVPASARLPETQRQKKRNPRAQTSNPVPISRWLRRETVVMLLIIAVLWVALFCNNANLLPQAVGFDRDAHADYIVYLQKHRALPLPNEGWEMFQPPLYYGISAAVLSTCGLSTADVAGAIVLRLLTMLFGIAQFTLVFLSLRLLFPGHIGRQLVGLVLAAFLPMQLYLSHYVTNETLAATLATAAIFLCLRLLRAENASMTGYAGLGFCMGAAMLTKATGVLLVPFIVIAVAIRRASQKSSLVTWLRTLGVMLAVCFVICGWYYLWIWSHFGTLLVGNWDAASGFHWWQDNGYHTASDFTRFGRSLVHPLFSVFAGFADGIYSTFWGDGLCGGATSLVLRPPWNYDLMCAGYLLAVLPTILVLAGTAVSVWRFIRKPSAEWFVLLGFSGAVVVALVFMSLKVPSSEQAKAFYGLCAVVPLCSFSAAGWEVLTRGRKWLQFAFGTILLVWAMNSFASVWIRGNSASTHVYLGALLDSGGRTDTARLEFARAVDADPADAQARRFLALTLNKSGLTGEAFQQAVKSVELNPTDAAGHSILSMILAGQGQMERALDEARRAVELGPEDLSARLFLSDCLSQLGRNDEVINVARNGLAVFPYDSSLRYTLGLALARKGDFAGATNQFACALLLEPLRVDAQVNFGRVLLRLGNAPEGLRHLQEAVRLAPSSPLVLNELAWLLATYPDATVRNGPEAVRLAEHACAMTGRRNPELLDTLAAAYAEAGRFPEAVNAAQEAISLARTAGDEAAVHQAENLLGFFQSGHPFRENPMSSP